MTQTETNQLNSDLVSMYHRGALAAIEAGNIEAAFNCASCCARAGRRLLANTPAKTTADKRSGILVEFHDSCPVFTYRERTAQALDEAYAAFTDNPSAGHFVALQQRALDFQAANKGGN